MESTMDLIIFTDDQLNAALTRYRADFKRDADAELLNSASCTHRMIMKIHDELDRRADLGCEWQSDD